MILADTSVVIDYLRAPSREARAALESRQIAICGVTRAEIIAGVRDVAEIPRVVQALDCLPQIMIPEIIWDELGKNASLLRGRGVTVPFPDLLIATIAVESGLPLWTRDKHFAAIQMLLPGLQLVAEPA